MPHTVFDILELWLRDFIATLDSGRLEAGNRSGIEPHGIKITFDGYGYNERTDREDNLNVMSLSIFIHKNSLTEDFPEHEETFWGVIHRPNEEICIYAVYFVNKDEVDMNFSFDRESTALSQKFVEKLISDIYKKYYT